MGRLDKFYSEKNISLNEKTNPPEQFKQLIEETGVCGSFQQFLEDHWQNIKIFSSSDFDKIRQILKTATLEPTFKEQVITFIRGFDTRYNLSLIFVYTLESEPREIPTEIAQRHTFAKNVATEVFPNDPLGFSRCFDIWDRMPEHIFLLNAATRFYGKDFFLSPEFVRSMDEETVWNVFWELFNQETIQDKSAFASYLEEWHNTNRVTFESEKFKFLQFIKTFLDVQIKQKSSKISFDCLRRIEKFLQEHVRQFDENSKNDNHWWFEAVRQELDVFWCLNVTEQGFPPDIEEELARRYHANYLFFMPGQSQTTILAMIKWSLKKDLEEWLRSERNTALLCRFASNVFSPLWYMSPYRSVWLKEFYDFLQALPIEQRCRLLSIPLGTAIFTIRDGELPIGIIPPKPDDYEGRDNYYTIYSYRVEEEDINNYDLYFKNLIDSKTLPKDIYFMAVENAIGRFSNDISFVLNHSNIVIGQLRGFVAANDASVPFEKLNTIWRMLEEHEPQKAFIHRLMLLRASASPCCDEKLEIKGTGPCSLGVMEIVQRLSVSRKEGFMEGRAGDIRKWFAEYCISRLQFRKNEKTDNDVYRNEQVVEPSPIWREAYLHALSELGTDLDGRIHKLAYFIKKFDPDSNVRDAASKCYKASRRNYIKSQDHDEIVRSLIAAYWWLLMGHIEALGIEPDHEGALQTRRRQLRR